MKFRFLQHLFGQGAFFSPLFSPADYDAVVTLRLQGWGSPRFTYHPHLYPLPPRERKFWLAMTSLWLTAVTHFLLTQDEFCIPWKEEECD